MARPKKHTVDYFPHDCHHSKEVEILINKFKNHISKNELFNDLIKIQIHDFW